MTKRVPDVFVIVFSLVLLAAVATWVLPGGHYERRKEQVGDSVREVAVPGSFQVQPSRPQTVQVFTAPIKGFLRLGDIIAFIFLVGGSFYILNETGAIAAGIRQLVVKLKGREYLVIPIVMTFFSFFGAVFGMCEEAMPFVLIFVPLALALGYDSIVGVCLSFLAAGVGFAGAFINPFTLQIAQGLAGIPLLSGMAYRVVIWVVVTALVIAWVMVYAARVKADPRRSPMYELDEARRQELSRAQEAHASFSWRDGACLGILFLGVAGMIVGVVRFHWYIVELAGLFFAMGVLAGAAAGMSPDRIARAFVAGCKDIAGAALIVGFAGGILVILENGNVMDTLLHAMASVTGKLPGVLAAHAMYLVQMGVNFFIPSGSTKAALTMPLMAPLADLSGITRQTAVLAYQFGDGFTNMIIPTSGVTVGTLAMAKIPFERWARWHWPMQLAFFLASLLFLAYAALTGWQG
ncbi:MAG: putative basic amino acid antiporter YfcC [Acidobacteriota bacterium]